jgi:hypothetical protein
MPNPRQHALGEQPDAILAARTAFDRALGGER